MNLHQARRKRKLSQDKLSEITGIMQYEISRIERGLVSPTKGTRAKLEQALGVPINWLSNKGTRRYTSQNWQDIELRFRKILYDVNYLSNKEQQQFLKLAKGYLKEVESKLSA